MFNTIIQPTGVYGSLPVKAQVGKDGAVSVQNSANAANSSTSGFNNVQKQTTSAATPSIKSENPDNIEEKPKKKNKLFVNIVILTFAVIGFIWGLPAIKNAINKKEMGLPKLEKQLIKKEQELLAKGEDIVEKDRKALEKERKTLERNKKIFKTINENPFLSKVKNKFMKFSEDIESKIRRPFSKFVRENVFNYSKKA